MKKIYLIVFTIATCLISCSDDDNSTESDKIIGQWYVYKEIDLFDNSITEYELDDDYSLKLTFNTDGTVFISASEESLTITYEGTWENLGNEIYKFTFDGDTEILEFTFIGSNEMKTNDGEYETYYKRLN